MYEVQLAYLFEWLAKRHRMRLRAGTSPSQDLPTLEDRGLYSMIFLSWNNPWFTVNVNVWKRKHTIFGKNIHICDVHIQHEKINVLFHSKPSNTINLLIFFYTFHSKQQRGVVRGCRWPFLCNLPPSFRSLMVWKDDNWCHIRLCFYEINGILGNERQKKSTTNGDVRWKWVFGWWMRA